MWSVDVALTQAWESLYRDFMGPVSDQPLCDSGSFAVINFYGSLNHIGRHMNRHNFMLA